jgi:ABC-type transport system substrate-binding protein
MNDSRPTIQIATAIGLFAVAIAVTMNTCAMDRLEDQVIATRKAVESGVSMGGSTMAAQAPRPMGSEVKPGDGTGLMVVGWGGARGEITHVEGAVDNAPLQISDKPKPQNDQYVNRRFNPPGSLNYFATNEGEANTVARYSLDRLIEVDPHAPPAVIPSLATSWEVSDDKLTYTYHLRKGVKFADGRDFTSADVKFSFDVVRDPEVTAQHLRAVVEEVASVTTPDDHTVVVQYRKKDFSGLFALGYFLRVMNAGWVQEQIPKYAKKLDIEEFSVTPGSPGFGEVFNKIRIPIPGSGPYFFVGDTFEPEHGIELAQNPFSWRTQVHPTWYNFTKLRWVFISDTKPGTTSSRTTPRSRISPTTTCTTTWGWGSPPSPGMRASRPSTTPGCVAP